MGIISGGNVIEGAQPRQLTVAGAPTSGAAGTFAGSAPAGAVLVATTNGDVYQNTNTEDSPTWTKIVDAGVVPAAQVEAASLDGAQVKVVADDNVIGGLEVLHRIDIPDAASGDADVVLTHKTRIIDVWAIKRGGGGHATEDTVTVKNAADAITDAIALGNADKAIKRASTIDDAFYEIAAGGTLRVSWVKGGSGGNDPECTVYVRGIRVA